MKKNIVNKEGYVFDIIYKEKESMKYRNYIIYTNKIVNEFFENNKCIIYVDCLYADGRNINTKKMFKECTELLFVDISKIKMESLDNTFYSCKKLQYVFLPKSNFNILGFSFYNCDNLKLVINIEKYSWYWCDNNFNESKNLLYFMANQKCWENNNELKCKYFDSSDLFNKNFYPTNDSSYIITTKPDNFMEYVKNGYKGNFLMSQKDKTYLKTVEDEEVKKKEEEKKKEDKKDEKKEEKKTPWEQGIVENRIKTFEEFKFKDEDFNIVKNENEEEVKTVDQIFYRFVQDEIKEIDDFLKEKMENWNKFKKKDKTYENFKNVFVSNYERKNLFVPE